MHDDDNHRTRTLAAGTTPLRHDRDAREPRAAGGAAADGLHRSLLSPRARRTRSTPVSTDRAAVQALGLNRTQGSEGLRLELQSEESAARNPRTCEPEVYRRARGRAVHRFTR